MHFHLLLKLSAFALIDLALLLAFAACEGRTITIEESTEQADGSRTVRVSSSGNGTPVLTPRPGLTSPLPHCSARRRRAPLAAHAHLSPNGYAYNGSNRQTWSFPM